MKRKVLFLKAPANVVGYSKFLTPGKLYRVQPVNSHVFGSYFYMFNDAKSDFYITELQAKEDGWEPIYNTEIYAGIIFIVAMAGLGGLILYLTT